MTPRMITLAGLLFGMLVSVTACARDAWTSPPPVPSTSPATTSPATTSPATTSPTPGRAQRRPTGTGVNLPLTEAIRRELGDAYFAAGGGRGGTRDEIIGPKDVYYGFVYGATPAEDVYYAVGETGYVGNEVSTQDGPHIWQRTGNGKWRHAGDTGGHVCVPRVLYDVWNLRSKYGTYDCKE